MNKMSGLKYIRFSFLVDLCKDERLKESRSKLIKIFEKFVKIELNELCSAECSRSQSFNRGKRQAPRCRSKSFNRGKRQTNIGIISNSKIADSSFFSSI
jgi:hypothetical protein